MAFFLSEHDKKVEYVNPFVCGLCGFGSGNIDLFHHHFETHADNIPSSMFHLCEMENTRDDETATEIGSFCCKTCNHTFPTVCNLSKHLDDDANTDKYIMDLQTKTAYPLTSQCASVLSHTFIGAKSRREEKMISRISTSSGERSSTSISTRNTSPKQKENLAKAQNRSGKTAPKQTLKQRFKSGPFEQILNKAQSNQKEAYDIFNSIDDIDYNDDNENNFDSDSDGLQITQDDVIDEIVVRTDPASQFDKQWGWKSCKYCGLSFRKRQKKSLRDHEEEHLTYEGNLKHTAESLCRCEQCGCLMKRVNSHLHLCPFKKTMRKRRPRAKPGEPKKTLDQTLTACPHCSKIFKKYFLSSHILRIHMVHAPVPCEICGKMLKNKYALSNHVANVHKGKKRFKCEKCDMRFISRYKLKVHMITHGNERNYQCDLCPKNYKHHHTLKAHKERIHKDEKERVTFQCELCPKNYGYRDGLSQHQRNVHNIRVKPIDLNKIKKPKKSEKNEESYYCDKCEKTFLLKCSFNQHLRKHADYFAKLPYLCDECPEKYHTKQGLKRHKSRKHREASQIAVFKCDKCPRSFGHSHSLNKHQRRYHNPEDNWHLCGWKTCRQKFKSEAEVEAHRSIHMDGVEFTCGECDRTYMTIDGLMQHNRRSHKPEQVHKGPSSVLDHAYIAKRYDVSSQIDSQKARTESSGFDRFAQTFTEIVHEDPGSDTNTQMFEEAAQIGYTPNIHIQTFEEAAPRGCRSLDTCIYTEDTGESITREHYAAAGNVDKGLSITKESAEVKKSIDTHAKVYILDIKKRAQLVSDDNFVTDRTTKDIHVSIREKGDGAFLNRNASILQERNMARIKETTGVKPVNTNNKERILTGESQALEQVTNVRSLSQANVQILKNSLLKQVKGKSMEGSSCKHVAVNIESSQKSEQQKGNAKTGIVLRKLSRDSLSTVSQGKLIILKKVSNNEISNCKLADAAKTGQSIT